MKLTAEIFVCFGIPFLAVLFYLNKFCFVDSSLFKIGLANTINFALCFSEVFTIGFWGMSGLNILIFLYLIFIAPILSIGFSYYIWVNKKDLVSYKYALISSLIYIGIFLFFIFGYAFQVPSSPIASTGQALSASSQSSISSFVSG